MFLQKCQFRLAREIFFIWERSYGQSKDFPHLVQSHAQFSYSEESPYSWTVQLKDGVEVRYAHLDTVIGRPDGLIEPQSPQILLKMGQDI